jgi:hypothetical protein
MAAPARVPGANLVTALEQKQKYEGELLSKLVSLFSNGSDLTAKRHLKSIKEPVTLYKIKQNRYFNIFLRTLQETDLESVGRNHHRTTEQYSSKFREMFVTAKKSPAYAIISREYEELHAKLSALNEMARNDPNVMQIRDLLLILDSNERLIEKLKGRVAPAARNFGNRMNAAVRTSEARAAAAAAAAAPAAAGGAGAATSGAEMLAELNAMENNLYGHKSDKTRNARRRVSRRRVSRRRISRRR